MVKCDNCDGDATYVMESLGSNTQYFCSAHLPLAYKTRAVLIPAVETTVVEPEVVAPRKRKKSSENSTENTDETGTPGT